eukprot:5538140-Amphidinium_carterae.1
MISKFARCTPCSSLCMILLTRNSPLRTMISSESFGALLAAWRFPPVTDGEERVPSQILPDGQGGDHPVRKCLETWHLCGNVAPVCSGRDVLNASLSSGGHLAMRHMREGIGCSRRGLWMIAIGKARCGEQNLIRLPTPLPHAAGARAGTTRRKCLDCNCRTYVVPTVVSKRWCCCLRATVLPHRGDGFQ